MTTQDGVDLLWFLGAITLVGSALLARQLQFSDMVKMALAWVAIFALLFLVVRTYMLVAG